MTRIERLGIRTHAKASETYVDAVFRYGEKELHTSVPIQYRRTGTNIASDDDKRIVEYIAKVYDEMNPTNWDRWRKELIRKLEQ